MLRFFLCQDLGVGACWVRDPGGRRGVLIGGECFASKGLGWYFSLAVSTASFPACVGNVGSAGR